jgi:flagellar biosynthesis/type III secretory pathway protein FliH
MPSPLTTLRLHAPPLEASLCAEGLETVCERRLRDKLDRSRGEGRLEGHAEAVEASARLLELAAERLEQERTRLHDEVAESGAHLVVEITRRILRKELEEGRYDIEAILRETLARSGVDREGCVVHLSPNDHARLEGVPFRAGTRLEPDPMVSRGDLQISTRQGLFVREIDEILRAMPNYLLGGES